MIFRQQRMMHLAFCICSLSLAVNAFAFRGIFLSPRHRYRRPLHLLSGSIRNPMTATDCSAKEGADNRGQKEEIAQDTKEASQSLNQAQFLADLDQSVEQASESLTVVSTIPWKFLGHDIYCRVIRPERATSSPALIKKPIVLLVHGFGCSTVYWRETERALSQQGYTMYSIDLLGHGKSAKPWENVTYSTNLWARQLNDFCRENLCEKEDIVLVGNSMGSIVALLAATGEFANEESPSQLSCNPHPYIKEHIAGIGMFNCGIGMNIHSIVRHEKWNPLQRYVLDAIFTFLETTIFGNVALMQWILDKIITRDFLRNTLLRLYKCAANPHVIVDETLVDSLYEPARDPNAAKVLCQILTNDPGMTPMEVHGKYGPFLDNLPIHVIWGDADTVTPIDGIGEVGQFYSALAASDDNKVTMEVVKAGHIPFDEASDIANGSMLRWLNKLTPC